ncbi:MAG: dehydrogenase, partial [Opitutae bacterium]|nr:dehydrogenase [Opitutae bacterium]
MPSLKVRNLLPLTILAMLASGLTAKIKLVNGDDICLVGAGMGSRMIHYGHFETEIYIHHSDLNLKIRNLCDEGNTPGFRPHPSRNQEEQYAFPGAKELIHDSLKAGTKPKGHFPTPDQWLSDLNAEVVLCFFGFNSS